MSASETGQVTQSAAEVYEEMFVPALFQQWPGRVADAAQVREGQRVLDERRAQWNRFSAAVSKVVSDAPIQ